MKKSIIVSAKAKKAIARIVQRDKARRPTRVLQANAVRADSAVHRLAVSRHEAQQLNQDLVVQKASV
jgi:hypothetical protein